MNSMVQAVRFFFMKREHEFQQTPIHYAFNHGNLELILCVIGFIKNNISTNISSKKEIDYGVIFY